MRYPEGLKILVVLTLVVAGCSPFLEDRSAQIRGECPMLSGSLARSEASCQARRRQAVADCGETLGRGAETVCRHCWRLKTSRVVE